MSPATIRNRARTPRGERSREAILNASMELFAEQGYEATSMVEIADRARISKSVIYDHFPSKTELHRALLEREANTLLLSLAASVPPPGEQDATERLRLGIEALFRFAEERPIAWRLLLRDPPTNPELAATHREIQNRGTASVAILIGGEELDDPAMQRHKEMLAELLKSAITGLAVWWSEHPEAPRQELVETAFDFAWFGLRHWTDSAGHTNAT